MHQNGVIQRVQDDYFVDTGSPHFIAYESDALNERNIVDFGRSIRYSDQYAEKGVNVNLITPLEKGKIAVRTYERGVEDETLACGTGATACGLSYADLFLTEQAGVVEVHVKGGELKIHYSKVEQGLFDKIWLEGPAAFVFKGSLDV
jgi:diaminopimelate epimerase